MSKSTSLDALPLDLIDCIVASIESQSTLCNLARCSRQLYFCTIRHLYRHVTILEKSPPRGEENREQPDGRLRKFTSLLIRKLDLAALVRTFTFCSQRPDEFEDFYDSEGPREPERSEEQILPNFVEVDQAFKTVVEASSSSNQEEIEWLRKLSHPHEGDHDLILALLLPTLLNVRQVALDLKFDGCTYQLEEMVRRAVRRERPFDIQRPFEALKVFQYSHVTFNEGGLSFIASLLKLPAIQEISADIGTPSDNFDEDGFVCKNLIDLETSSSPLTTLDLVGSRSDVGHILRAPKALKNLLYKVCPPDSNILSNIRHGLKAQENYLEILGLDYDHEYEDHYLSDSISVEPMPSFQSFKNLKVFKTSVRFLETTENGTGRHRLSNIFPPSLETLHLTCVLVLRDNILVNMDSVLHAVEYLLSQKSLQQTPSLKKLILEETGVFNRSVKLANMLWKDTAERAIEGLARVGASQGIDIEVIEADFDGPTYEDSQTESSLDMYEGEDWDVGGSWEEDDSSNGPDVDLEAAIYSLTGLSEW